MTKAKKRSEYTTFDRMMRKLLSVPHSEIKARLDAEKQGEKRKVSARRKSNGRDA